MVLSEEVNPIKEELVAISEGVFLTNLNEEKHIIKNRRAFAKTNVFQKLRKGELTFDEIKLILDSFSFKGEEIGEFILKFIPEHGVKEYIESGAFYYEVDHANVHYIANQFSNKIRRRLVIKNAEEEMKMFLLEALKLPLKKFDTADLDFFLDFLERFLEKEFPMGKHDEAYVKNFGLIKKVYEMVFTSCEHLDRLVNSRTGSVSLLESLDLTEKMEIEVYSWLSVLKIMPNISVDLFKEILMVSENWDRRTKFLFTALGLLKPERVELYYTRSPKELLEAYDYLDFLYESYEIDEETIKIFQSLIEYDILCLIHRNFYCADKERVKRIYKRFFDNKVENSLWILRRIKAMVSLRLPDKMIAKEINDNFQILINNNHLVQDIFLCNPSAKNTYPEFYTWVAILGLYQKGEDLSPISIDEKGRPCSKEIENVVFDKRGFHGNSIYVFTWKQMSNINFMRKLAENLDGSYFRRRIINKAVIKNIGFSNYMDMLADVGRVNQMTDRMFPERFQDYISSLDEKVLKEATEEELYSIKNYAEITNIYCVLKPSLKFAEYLLTLIESKNQIIHSAYGMNLCIDKILREAKDWTAHEKLKILDRYYRSQFLSGGGFYLVAREKSGERNTAFEIMNIEPEEVFSYLENREG